MKWPLQEAVLSGCSFRLLFQVVSCAFIIITAAAISTMSRSGYIPVLYAISKAPVTTDCGWNTLDEKSENSVTEGQERKGENKNVVTYFTSIVVPARTGFIICSNQEGHGQNPEIILYYLNSLPGVGEGSLFQGEGLPPGHGCRWAFYM